MISPSFGDIRKKILPFWSFLDTCGAIRAPNCVVKGVVVNYSFYLSVEPILHARSTGTSNIFYFLLS